MVFNRYITAAEFDALAGLFRRNGTVECFSRNEPFAEQGRRPRRCGLVEAGLFRYVHTAETGDRHVVGYAFEGEFVGDYVAMRTGRPGYATIEAVCDSRVRTLSDDRIEAFYRTGADCERLGRRVAELLSAEIYERLLQSYASTPQAMYEELLGRCSALLDCVPLKELASYLRVRPETLSRIRRRVR